MQAMPSTKKLEQPFRKVGHGIENGGEKGTQARK